MPIKQFKLPDLGEGLTEADILTWTVAVGDTVEVNTAIVEVETAKAAVELPSPYAGVVAALHVGAGRHRRGRHADHPIDVGRAASPAPAGVGRRPACRAGGRGRTAHGAASQIDARRLRAAPRRSAWSAAAPQGPEPRRARRRRSAESPAARSRAPPPAPVDRSRRGAPTRSWPAASACWPSRRCASWPRPRRRPRA